MEEIKENKIEKIENEIRSGIYTKKLIGIKPRYLIVDKHHYLVLECAGLVIKEQGKVPLYKGWLEVVLSQRREKHIDVV